jgi:hypothetical protein
MIDLLSNTVSPDGMRCVKIVSDKPLTEARMLRFVPGAALEFAQVKVTPTAALSLFHGEVTYPCRGVLRFQYQVPSTKFQVPDAERERHLVVWRMMPEEGYRVSEIVEILADWYFVKTHRRAGYGFMRKLPAGVEVGTEVEGITLFEAEWALEKCVMVGG